MLREGPTSRPVLHVSTLESMGGSHWREGGRGRETESDGPIQRGWTLGLPVPSSYLPQAPAKRLIIQTNWTKIRDDRRHNEKAMGFRAENSERDGGNKGESTDYPMGSTSPSFHSASRCFWNTRSWSQPRLIQDKAGGIFLCRTWMNTHTNIWEDQLLRHRFKETSTIDKPVHTHRESDLIFCILLLILAVSNSQAWANLYRKPMKWKLGPKHREGKNPGESMQTLQGVEETYRKRCYEKNSS